MPLSTFLNDRNPGQLRGLLWLGLSDTGVVLSNTSTSDDGGGVTQAWTAGGTVPCRIDPINEGQPRTTGGAIDERSTHVVTVPPGTSVSSQNRFSITGRGTFEITATHRQTGEHAGTFEVIEVS